MKYYNVVANKGVFGRKKEEEAKQAQVRGGRSIWMSELNRGMLPLFAKTIN